LKRRSERVGVAAARTKWISVSQALSCGTFQVGAPGGRRTETYAHATSAEVAGEPYTTERRAVAEARARDANSTVEDLATWPREFLKEPRRT